MAVPQMATVVSKIIRQLPPEGTEIYSCSAQREDVSAIAEHGLTQVAEARVIRFKSCRVKCTRWMRSEG
jgi:hypothetical protein